MVSSANGSELTSSRETGDSLGRIVIADVLMLSSVALSWVLAHLWARVLGRSLVAVF
jgi:hypothetical protein